MPSADKFRIALIQASCAIDPNQNLARTEWKIREAAGGGAQIVCLQELFRSVYFCQIEDHKYFNLAEEIRSSERAESAWPARWKTAPAARS